MNSARVAKTKKGKIILLSKCAVCDNKTLRFIKEQETNELLSNLGLKFHYYVIFC